MKRGTSSENLDTLSDIELHQKLLQYGLPNVPVTETTRCLLINRLKNHIKNEKIKRKQNAKKSLPDNWDDLQPRNSGQMYNSFYNSNSCNNSLSFSQTTSPAAYVRSSSRMFAPPPILATDNTEDLRRTSYLNSERLSYSNSSSNNNQMPKTQFGMVGRLLSFRETLKKTSGQGVGTAHDNQKIFYKNFQNKSLNNNKIMHNSQNTTMKPFFMRFEMGKGSQQAFISQALVCAFFVFFIALALIYVFMSPDHSKTIHEIGTRSVVCDNEKENITQISQNCIKKENLESTLTLNKQLLTVLQERAKIHHCVNKTSPAGISISEFLNIANENSIEHAQRPLSKILQDMNHLIINNPQWKITITDSEGETFFVLVKPNLPFTCVFIKKLTQFFAIVGTGAVIGILLTLSYAVFKFFKRRQQIKAETTEQFATKIINELLEKKSEIVVNHLRDTLVPLNKRKTLLKSWNEALKLLESNDSRVQFAVKTKNGEEVKTIQWVGGMPEKFNFADSAATTNVKQWQSPAFDNRNQIVHPPTPCLKIRHMFDASDIGNPNLKQLIISAIVEKVGPKCNICDVQLDKQTCCVYVRCASEKDAGLIHNEINGWWFDKKLVSIKFLRLERYLSRFPKSQAILNNC